MTVKTQLQVADYSCGRALIGKGSHPAYIKSMYIKAIMNA